jgi:hypothetical protein
LEEEKRDRTTHNQNVTFIWTRKIETTTNKQDHPKKTSTTSQHNPITINTLFAAVQLESAEKKKKKKQRKQLNKKKKKK